MKKLFLILALTLTATFGYSQKAGIKLAAAQTFTLIPATTQIADSISISPIIDSGTSVYVNLWFVINGKGSNGINNFIVWEGAEYKQNENWTNATVVAKIKQRLNIK